ncbi:MAG TPA: hypothetical protein VG347_05140 [Verrucomicrobiae bacterium]|nr:hypothetical protein [Verrucomicrobiae bacterium]
MKNIFRRPIGTLRDLGTPLEWTADGLLLLCLIAAIVAALLF